ESRSSPSPNNPLPDILPVSLYFFVTAVPSQNTINKIHKYYTTQSIVLSNISHFMHFHRKRKRKQQYDDDEPYIKKPLNAFMLYKMEQRPKVLTEMNIKQNATVNKILGERWNLLPDEEKTRYYEEAKKERLLHAQRHPNWSTSDNYVCMQHNSRTVEGESACTSKPLTCFHLFLQVQV
uniref:HMG box domain-containing protein n=1 Tax=Mola mola TaxID=94237 RepID=A0A3Q3VRT6_MOLML